MTSVKSWHYTNCMILQKVVLILSTKAKSRKWTMVVFSYMLDTARVNSSTIYALNTNVSPLKQKSFDYGFDLVMQLVKPHIAQRNQTSLSTVIKQKIALIMGPNAGNDQLDTDDGPAFGESRRRCTLCQHAAAGEGYSERKKSIKCVKSLCQSCGNPSCQDHIIQKCMKCEKK